MATKLTKKQQTQITEKLAGIIQKNNAPQLRLSADRSVNEMNVNQISGELNRIHDMAIGKELPTVINIPVSLTGYEITGIGTIYGGELNIETRTLVSVYSIVDLGALTWTYVTTDAYAGAPYFQSEVLTDMKPGTSNIYCERYRTARDRARIENGTIAPWNPTTAKAIVVRDDSYTDAITFKTDMSGVLLAYELKTPETYILTPQQMLQLLDQL